MHCQVHLQIHYPGLVMPIGKAQRLGIRRARQRRGPNKTSGRNEEGTMASFESDIAETLITLTSDIVAAHVSNNSVSVDEVPALITKVYGALAGLGSVPAVPEKLEPAVSIRSSVKNDH